MESYPRVGGVSQSLMTSLSLAIKILPYFGYSDQCKILMTQLRSESRQLWLSNEDKWLKPYTDEQGIEKLHIKRKHYSINNLEGSHSSEKVSADSELFKLRDTGDYKLYNMTFKFTKENIAALETLATFCETIDREFLTVRLIHIWRDTNLVPYYDLLLKIVKALNVEVEEHKIEEATYFKFKPPLVIRASTQEVDATKNQYVCDKNWTHPNHPKEVNSVIKINIGNFEPPELVDCLEKLLKTMSMSELLKKIGLKRFEIQLTPGNFERDEPYLQKFSEILERHKNSEGSEKCDLPKICLKWGDLFKKKVHSLEPDFLSWISTFQNIFSTKGLKIDYKNAVSSYQFSLKCKIRGDEGFMTHNNQTMKLSNVYSKIYSDFAIDQESICNRILE
ncbi:unnamed protein product [Moneuplotes crassus]|uniref:Uncharacterized protein n=1 Tax=Euplotes crassus TaxID=5936 RepID=A0AAD1Y324_EUPCR|nr:unnamed protein product [Moneuplotes crassus]